jgi:Flp pilus assembly protein TadG
MMRGLLRHFRAEQTGTSAVEFALLLPVLLALLLGTVTLFDLFRTQQNIEKATFTIGDVLSRQLVINQPLVTSMLSLLKQLVPTASDGGVRVSSISNRGGELQLDWSSTSGDTELFTPPIPYDVVPDMAVGDSVILTETFVPHGAVFSGFGLERLVYTNRAVHRPRFLSSVNFQ